MSRRRTVPGRRRVGPVVLLVLAAILAACRGAAEPAGPGGPGGGEDPAAAHGCGPIAYDDVGGRPPAYLSGPLATTPNEHALCAGWWLPPATDADFVPQGLAVRDRTAWVSGYDDGPFGEKYCRVLRIDLRTARATAERAGVEGRIGFRAPVGCRHGGGLALDEHGLWLAEKNRLWLLDPASLATVRAWAIVAPVWGSYLLTDPAGRLGVAGFGRRAMLHWFEPADLLAPGVIEVEASAATARQPAPARGQGAFWADLAGDDAGDRGRRGRVWFIESHTRCGVLRGGPDQRLGFLPGAEGATYRGGWLWVLSESTAAPYWRAGGRPVVPQLARYDVRDVSQWEAPDCEL